MSTIEFSTVRRSLAARTRHRTKRAVRRGAPELRTLVKFTLVGGSGYVVNLAVFAAVVASGADHVIAVTAAFLVAVGNNFHWNRRWTFNAVGAQAIHRQAQRFFIISGIGFLLQLGIFELLDSSGTAPLIAQAISLVIVTPIGFLGNRLWTFAEPGTLRGHVSRVLS